jgi:hypothetical protein
MAYTTIVRLYEFINGTASDADQVNEEFAQILTALNALGTQADTNQTKLDGIAAGAEVNVQSDWNQTDDTADDYIKNKPTVPGILSGTTTLNVSADGSDTTGDGSVTTPYATIQHTLDILPKDLGGYSVTINVRSNTTESVYIKGFHNGVIKLTGYPITDSNKTVNYIGVSYCTANIGIEHITTDWSGISITSCSLVTLSLVSIIANSNNGVVIASSHVQLSSCTISNSSQRAIYARLCSTAHVIGVAGTTNPVVYKAESGSTIFVESCTITGTTQSQITGSQIIGL